MHAKVLLDSKNWKGVKGYLKIPFDGFTKRDMTTQKITREYIEQQFNASIGTNAFTIKNDGIIREITVFLNDGSNFTLDLTKLKP